MSAQARSTNEAADSSSCCYRGSTPARGYVGVQDRDAAVAGVGKEFSFSGERGGVEQLEECSPIRELSYASSYKSDPFWCLRCLCEKREDCCVDCRRKLL